LGAALSAAARSYYGRPVIRRPVWTWEVPTYFFTGGLAGASAGFAYAAELAGHDRLARRSWLVAAGAISASPPLLISDLGRPGRFLNMMRVVKVTSPMSLGSWLLGASGTAIAVTAADRLAGDRLPSAVPRAARVAAPAAGVLGMPLATYTGALISNTAVPAWHEARRGLPFMFGGGAAASAGAAGAILSPPREAGPARRLAIGGAVAGLTAAALTRGRLGDVGEAYKSGRAGAFSRAATALAVSGAAVLAGPGRRNRAAAIVGGTLTLGSALAERFAVFHAGLASAEDPAYTVGPQRERLRGRG
jgi:hypothetical protein